MNLEKVIFAFFIVLALTLNFGFYEGQIDNPVHRNIYELYTALVVSYTAITIGFGELPYAFTDVLHMWLTIAVYAAVATWAYSIGAAVTAVQDPAFRTLRTA